MKRNLSETCEDYLEQIYCYELNGIKDIRSSMLVDAFKVSKAAVTKITNKLTNDGYLLKEAYGNITLTKKGRHVAKETLHKHQVIRTFLRSIGVSKENAEIDCCKIEHIICKETLQKLEDYNKNHN